MLGIRLERYAVLSRGALRCHQLSRRCLRPVSWLAIAIAVAVAVAVAVAAAAANRS